MILSLALLCSAPLAQEPDLAPQAAPLLVTVQPYAGLLDYDNSEKESGWLWGTYGSAYSGRHKLELGYEYTELWYHDSRVLEQDDFTVVYTNYFDPSYLGRIGAHYVASTDVWSDGGRTLFGGLKYYEGLEFDAGLDVYYTHYPDYPGAAGTPRGLDIWQVSPSIGQAFGDFESTWGSFYARLGYVHIHPVDSDQLHLDSGYDSVQAALSNFNGAWTTAADVWVGTQVFGVRNDGFTVYNLAEEHRGGGRLAVSYVLGDAVSLKVSLAYERFREVQNDSDSGAATLVGFLSFSF